MGEKYVRSEDGTADKLFQSEPTLVYWLTVTPKAVATVGLIKILDGTDSSGKVKWQAETGVVIHFIFSPPIRCSMGLFIDVDTNIDLYTVGFLPEEVALKKE